VGLQAEPPGGELPRCAAGGRGRAWGSAEGAARGGAEEEEEEEEEEEGWEGPGSRHGARSPLHPGSVLLPGRPAHKTWVSRLAMPV